MDDAVFKKIKKNPIVIEGFPGFGLVGSIVTEFLVQHLACEKLDNHYFEELPASVAIHGGKVLDPISIYYNSRFNIVIFHAIVPATGVEWKAAELVLKLCEKVKAKRLISVEGVGSGEKSKNRIFYYSSETEQQEILKRMKLEPLSEGIILGVTSALLIRGKLPITCLFGETDTQMPDNKAAAKIIESLDTLLGLDVNPEPLVKSAKFFEEKFKGILDQTQAAHDDKDKKMMSYVG